MWRNIRVPNGEELSNQKHSVYFGQLDQQIKASHDKVHDPWSEESERERERWAYEL